MNSLVVRDGVPESRGEAYPSTGRRDVSGMIEGGHLGTAVGPGRIERVVAVYDEVERGCGGEAIHVSGSATIH